MSTDELVDEKWESSIFPSAKRTDNLEIILWIIYIWYTRWRRNDRKIEWRSRQTTANGKRNFIENDKDDNVKWQK